MRNKCDNDLADLPNFSCIESLKDGVNSQLGSIMPSLSPDKLVADFSTIFESLPINGSQNGLYREETPIDDNFSLRSLNSKLCGLDSKSVTGTVDFLNE